MPASLRLHSPNIAFRDSYRELVAEFMDADEQLIPFPLKFPHDDFPALIERLEADRNGIGIDEGFVANSTFWLVRDESVVVGVSNLRHELTDRLRLEGGHIGYGVRPSARREGHGREILRLTLTEAGKLGINSALLTCDKTNTASAATIIGNGGVFEGEDFCESHGEVVQRYWVPVS